MGFYSLFNFNNGYPQGTPSTTRRLGGNRSGRIGVDTDPFDGRSDDFLSPKRVLNSVDLHPRNRRDQLGHNPTSSGIEGTTRNAIDRILGSSFLASTSLGTSPFFQGSATTSSFGTHTGSLFSSFPTPSGILFDTTSYGNALANRQSVFNRPIAFQPVNTGGFGHNTFVPFNPDNPASFAPPVVGFPTFSMFGYTGGSPAYAYALPPSAMPSPYPAYPSAPTPYPFIPRQQQPPRYPHRPYTAPNPNPVPTSGFSGSYAYGAPSSVPVAAPSNTSYVNGHKRPEASHYNYVPTATTVNVYNPFVMVHYEDDTPASNPDPTPTPTPPPTPNPTPNPTPPPNPNPAPAPNPYPPAPTPNPTPTPTPTPTPEPKEFIKFRGGRTIDQTNKYIWLHDDKGNDTYTINGADNLIEINGDRDVNQFFVGGERNDVRIYQVGDDDHVTLVGEFKDWEQIDQGEDSGRFVAYQNKVTGTKAHISTDHLGLTFEMIKERIRIGG